jgi:hypothetical protein
VVAMAKQAAATTAIHCTGCALAELVCVLCPRSAAKRAMAAAQSSAAAPLALSEEAASLRFAF